MEKMGQPWAPKVREDHEFPRCELQGSLLILLFFRGWLFYKTNNHHIVVTIWVWVKIRYPND